MYVYTVQAYVCVHSIGVGISVMNVVNAIVRGLDYVSLHVHVHVFTYASSVMWFRY